MISRQEMFDIIKVKLREVWPSQRLLEYSENIFGEVLERVKNYLFDKNSRSSILGDLEFWILDKNKEFINLDIAWSRIDLPQDMFKEKIKILVKYRESERYYDLVKSDDSPRILSAFPPSFERRSSLISLISGNFNLYDLERWFIHRRLRRKFSDLFKKICLDISCLDDSKVFIVSVNPKIPAFLLLYKKDNYLIITDNGKDKVPCFCFTNDVQNKRCIEFLKKNFYFFSKRELEIFLSFSAINSIPGFHKTFDNYLKRDYLSL